MLVEVQCDKFIKHGEIRKPIQFHAGLNTVIGDDNGSNSVGKSTFLMILDFVFGGKDYVNKCMDVQENGSYRRKVMSAPHLSQRWEGARMSQQMCCSVSARRWTVMWKTLWNVY